MQSGNFILNQTQNLSSMKRNMLELTQIRDNLLISLISQLSFNRALLSDYNFPPQIHPNLNITLCKIEENKVQQTELNSEQQRQKIKKNRKLLNKNSNKKIIQSLGIKNDTKNIPKNYGKAILSYILRSPKTRKIVSQYNINLPDFLIQIRKMKNKINSIDGLRKMWGSDDVDSDSKKCIRILSYQFMRKHCLRYIFHSKVRNFCTHIKYRQKLIEGIENPSNFSHIKQY